MISQAFLARVQHNLTCSPKGPYCLDLALSSSCNLDCLYCSGKISAKPKDLLSKDTLLRLLDSAQALGVKEISLTSLIGEPTVFKNLRFLMGEIKKRGFFGTLLTNGSRLDEDFAKFLKEIGWDIIIVSIDSFSDDIQYQLRPMPGKQKYLEAIHRFLRYSAEQNPRVHLNFNMVVNKLNYAYVKDYFRIVDSYNAKNVTLLKLVRMNEQYDALSLHDEEMQSFRALLSEIETKVTFNRLEWIEKAPDGRDSHRPVQHSPLKKICYFHLYKLLINCDGQVLKCNGDPLKTKFNVIRDDLEKIYGRILSEYEFLREYPYCYESCCSPIKQLNQELEYYLEGDGVEKKAGCHEPDER
ncbi:MAG: radical SAM protein [Candidatus Omnitrophica bacterium]|nr:radical SAM protein [Candidatus Omnitrophota bacterium]